MPFLHENTATTTSSSYSHIVTMIRHHHDHHHNRRNLQFSSSSSSSSSFFNSDSYSMILVVIIVIIFFLLLAGAIKRQRDRRIPSREDLLEQRRRQRALIRRERLRRMGIDPSANNNNVQTVEQVQLTAEQAKIRRKNIIRMFEQTKVQTVIKEDNLVKDQTQQSTSIEESDEEQPTQQQQQQRPEDRRSLVVMEFPLVRLPNRKPTQPDFVPNQCAICLESYEVGETIVWSNNAECQHAFHQDCVLDYLTPLNMIDESPPPCPCCRQPFCSAVISSSTMQQQRNVDPPGRRIAR